MSQIDDLKKKIGSLKNTTKTKASAKAKSASAKKTSTRQTPKRKTETRPATKEKVAPKKDDPLKPLELKQEMFCQEYLIDLNATQAAIRAGYTEKSARVTASKMLTNANIQARVQELFDARAKRVQVDQDYVLRTIIDTVERCNQTVKPVLNKAGDHQLTETKDGEGLAYIFDAGNTLRGAELLGKHLKMFTDKVEQSGPNGGPVETVTRIELVAPE